MEDWATFAFEHAPIGLVYTENREIRRCNARFAEMFCYPPEELTGQSLSILYPSSEEFHRIGQLGADKMKIKGNTGTNGLCAANQAISSGAGCAASTLTLVSPSPAPSGRLQTFPKTGH